MTPLKRVSDQPFGSIWTETDDLAATAREFESKGGILLGDTSDRQLWLIQGYLVTLVRASLQVHPTAPIPKIDRVSTLLTNLVLAVIFCLFAYTFIGTILLMSMRR